MQIKSYGGVTYTVYNPIPNYNGRVNREGTWGRTPLVIRRSEDDGRTYGPLNIIEDDESRGYCYPALFFTKDNSLLCAYCRGGLPDEEFCLQRMGITKIDLAELEKTEA